MSELQVGDYKKKSSVCEEVYYRVKIYTLEVRLMFPLVRNFFLTSHLQSFDCKTCLCLVDFHFPAF